ncbi:Ldh family oxidoreductase [Roseibium marinum]|uniref:(2R)-3-sulfolactate dehydrogenase (NADP+) n=1 Tax=Roseibium marinum TaxID=281252 RepID=A0A2S3UN96_9HYPH|nr:Ldh family oxidoreductase [Roseibium marinum]POF29182.1 (2R)-3-sulfolactate dehydrogenase (NADP+) [Roseibium marinum]
MTRTVSIAEAERLAAKALIAAGTAPENAAPVARALVAAEASGQPGHGLSRMPSYVEQVRSGKVHGTARPSCETVKPGLVRIDAGHGFAYPAIDLAQKILPDMARRSGVALAAIHRSHHFGQGGAHCEVLAQKGLVAMVFGNAPKAIAPWGASRPMFGTNPICFAAPGPAGAPPLVIDFAVSRVAKGKIMAASRTGRPIPEGWALDDQGRPATDAAAAMNGTMVPIGEAKGAALALMIEVLSAALVGAHFGFEANGLFDGKGAPPNLAQTILAIDPGLASDNAYWERIGLLFSEIEQTEGARLPGSRRLEARETAVREGLRIPEEILLDLLALAGEAELT